jgi:hypothetical protein
MLPPPSLLPIAPSSRLVTIPATSGSACSWRCRADRTRNRRSRLSRRESRSKAVACGDSGRSRSRLEFGNHRLSGDDLSFRGTTTEANREVFGIASRETMPPPFWKPLSILNFAFWIVVIRSSSERRDLGDMEQTTEYSEYTEKGKKYQDQKGIPLPPFPCQPVRGSRGDSPVALRLQW